MLKKNKKAGFCRNYAIRNSKSDYIAFIDSDDSWSEYKLEKQIRFMEDNNFLNDTLLSSDNFFDSASALNGIISSSN